mmetsp:Transcript_7641/g.11110  ORF Transcript_7641/g.11110 Transcript_7641/m.11110 type:complete len:99 (+) Transcript_7641:36-332(+)
MVLSAQATRSWKLASALITTGVTFHAVLYVDYDTQARSIRNNEKRKNADSMNELHVFSSLQRWYRTTVDGYLLGSDLAKLTKKNTTSKQQPQEQEGEQ